MKSKKIFILIFVLCYIIVGFRISVKASENEYWNDAKTHNYTTNVVEEKELATDTTYIHDSGYSTRSGTKVDQDLFVLLQDCNEAEGLKVVTWGGYNVNHTVSTAIPRMTLANIARDYEKNHPGWKVVGGINADQYCWGYGIHSLNAGYDILENRPYFAMKADGENWFSHHFLGGTTTNLVGFLNDGNKQIVYNTNVNEVAPVFKLNVYDKNNNLLGKFDVNDLNPEPKLSGEYTYVYALTDTDNTTAPLSRSKETTEKEISSSNDLYIVSAADKTWVGSSVDYSWFKTGVNSFFGKGEIDTISKSATITATQFAIETTNPELLKVINKGCYVVAQYEIYGGYENCESAIGWHRVQRLDNVDNRVSASEGYNNKAYPRSVFGVTNDGKIALITGQGTTKSGFYAQEINAVCKAYDIKTAFQMDGGGSVTMIIRNELGNFETVNKPSDGSDRSIYNGLFFVVKDLDAKFDFTEIKEESLNIDININDFYTDEEITNVYFNIYTLGTNKQFSKTVEIIDNKVFVDGLQPNTEYSYKIIYKVKENGKSYSSLTCGSITTAKTIPDVMEILLDNDDGKLKVSIKVKDLYKAIVGIMEISFDGGETYHSIRANSSITIKKYDFDALSNIVLKYYYNLNNNKGEIKIITEEVEVTYTTLVFFDSVTNDWNSFVDDIFSE